MSNRIGLKKKVFYHKLPKRQNFHVLVYGFLFQFLRK